MEELESTQLSIDEVFYRTLFLLHCCILSLYSAILSQGSWFENLICVYTADHCNDTSFNV